MVTLSDQIRDYEARIAAARKRLRELRGQDSPLAGRMAQIVEKYRGLLEQARTQAAEVHGGPLYPLPLNSEGDA